MGNARQWQSQLLLCWLSVLPFVSSFVSTVGGNGIRDPLSIPNALSASLENQALAIDSTNNEQSTTKIVVVGAGISGLSVAYNLWKLSSTDDTSLGRKLDIEIVEARDRIGGRVESFLIDSDNDVWIDLGGQWLHESCPENPIRRLMEDDLKLDFVQTKSKSTNRFRKRQQKNVLFDETGNRLGKAAVQRAKRIFYKAVEDLDEANDLHGLGAEFQSRDRDSISFRELLDRRIKIELESDNRSISTPSFERAMNYFVHRAEGYEGGNFDQVSAYLANNLYDELGGPDRVVKGSYKRLLDTMCAKMGLEESNDDKTNGVDNGPCRIRLRQNTKVERIEYGDSDSVSLAILENNEESSTLQCDYCVCTVPLGVLQQRKIEFDPPLSQARQEAIDGIGMGILNKIVFRFDFDTKDSKFWGDLQQFGICHSDPALVKTYYDCTSDYYDSNATTARKSAILIQFFAGSAAERVDPPISAALDGRTDQEAIDESLEALRTVFGNVPAPSVAKVTRWRRDPLSCGSYSFAKIGTSPSMYDEIATPLSNRLMFAGEHTSKHRHSTVHGAFETGVREASRIFEKLL